LEDWILKAANEANINLQHFGLPNNAEELHRFINIRTDNFEKLVENIKDKSDIIKRLKRCLHLRKNFSNIMSCMRFMLSFANDFSFITFNASKSDCYRRLREDALK